MAPGPQTGLLRTWQGQTQNLNAGPLVQKLLRISGRQEQRLKASMVPLCVQEPKGHCAGGLGHMPRKSALLSGLPVSTLHPFLTTVLVQRLKALVFPRV